MISACLPRYLEHPLKAGSSRIRDSAVGPKGTMSSKLGKSQQDIYNGREKFMIQVGRNGMLNAIMTAFSEKVPKTASCHFWAHLRMKLLIFCQTGKPAVARISDQHRSIQRPRHTSVTLLVVFCSLRSNFSIFFQTGKPATALLSDAFF